MLASLERYSDSVFRTLCYNHGADLTFTEMAHVNSFLNRNRGSLQKIEPKDSTPVQIQILSSNEGKLDRFLSGFKTFNGFRGFNLNLSCPSKDVIRQGKGAAMVKRATKTGKLMALIRDHGHPVSVKIRLGLNQYEKDNKLYLNNLGGVDPDFFVVHAKHAGQSSGEPEDDSVYPECVEAAISGVMMGRPAMGNPAIFDLLKNEMGMNDPPRPVPRAADLGQEYRDLFDSIGGAEKYRFRVLKVIGRKRAIY